MREYVNAQNQMFSTSFSLKIKLPISGNDVKTRKTGKNNSKQNLPECLSQILLQLHFVQSLGLSGCHNLQIKLGQLNMKNNINGSY